MKIVYIPPKNKKKEIRLYSNIIASLGYFLPMISSNPYLSLIMWTTILVFAACSTYILATLFIPRKMTLEEEIEQHEFMKKVNKYYADLRGPEPVTNAKPKNLL